MKILKGSVDLVEERKNALKRLMPEVFTEGKIDPNKLREALGDLVETSGERYSFTWAGKIQSIRMRDKRSKATLVPSKKESVNFDETNNIFIEGENLEVLKILQKAYEGKIKMIYIDPPYNTGNDFVYKDDFSDSLKNYLRYTGQIGEKGEKLTTNTETSGRYHSNWLTMMYPRLALARNLLTEDGVIFVSIDDNEVHNLRLLMNEIFGGEQFIGQFVWKSRQNKDNRNVTGASIDHEYILCYGKSVRGDERKLGQYGNPDNDPRGPWTSGNMVGLLPEDKRPNCHYDLINPETEINYGKPKLGWRYDKNTMSKLIKDKRIMWPTTPDGRPRRKVFLSELKQKYTGFSSVVGNEIFTRDGTSEIENLFGFRAMEFPKPSELIAELIVQGCSTDDIVLDFFAGSGTTAQAVMELNKEDNGNRKFILVQLPEKTEEDSEAYKAGYKTIADIGKERIRKVIKKIKEEQKQQKLEAKQNLDLGFKVLKLSKSNCFVWDSEEAKDPNTLVKHIEESAKGASKADPGALVFELMLREGFKLNSKIQQTRQGKNLFFKVTDGEHLLWMCFDDKIDDGAVKKLSLSKDDKLIVFDSSLTDSQKVNLARRFRVETV